MRYRRLQSLFRYGSIVLRFSIIALVVAVLLLISKANLFQTSAIAQIPMQSMPSNPCSALMQRDFASIGHAPTAILSAQIIPATAQTPEYCDVNGYVTPQIQFEVRLPTQNWNRRYLQSGRGSIDDAANFVGVMPSPTPNERIDWIGNDLFESE